MQIGCSTLSNLARIRDYRSRRVSSYARDGSNEDYYVVQAGETRELAGIEGAGCIKHLWMTMGSREPAYPRRTLLRMFWDGERAPSVEAPIGDFFGMGHGQLRNFISAPLQLSPQDGKGMNCWFPMPFAEGARLEIENQGDESLNLYFYVDYEEYRRLEDDLARFHAQWRRENPTRGWEATPAPAKEDFDAFRHAYWKKPNTTPEENYVILEAEGRGHYVGCHLDIDVFQRQKNDWYGEGDDMIFIDGEPWPPSLHGTGTEDYYNCAYCPRQEHHAPYHGLILYNEGKGWRWKGKQTVYRYHVEDPIHFEKSIRFTIEHGHDNKLSNDYSSTAYWYQTEPHAPFPTMLPVAERMPRPDEPQYEPGSEG